MQLLRRTQSLCPECTRILDAEIYEDQNIVWIKKTCSEHGEVVDKYWEDYEMYKRAEKYGTDEHFGVENPNVDFDGKKCPFECGLCGRHKSQTALANVVLTNRCDLSCWYCFFFQKEGEPIYEPTLDQIREMFKTLRAEKPVATTAIQLTGGEPCLQDDLVEIIKIAKQEGFDHVQLNTNGIRLSQDAELVKKVRAAGVNTLYLSFDGVTPKSNPKNYWEIPAVIENCRAAGMGIVLVPTVIRGVNDHELGDMLRFSFNNADMVHGLNIQPVSLVGKMPRSKREKHRITIPAVIKKIEEQTNGEIPADAFFPVPSVMPISNFVEAFTKRPHYKLSTHFSCGMATYVFQKDGKMLPITEFIDVDGLFNYLNEKAAEIKSGKSKYVVGLKILAKINSFIDKEKAPRDFSVGKIIYNALVKHDYSALSVFHHKSLLIGLMHFMDKFSYDVQRVERCCIHYAMPDGRIVPFCAFNVVPEAYRDKIQREYSISVSEWERRAGKKLADEKYNRKYTPAQEKQIAEFYARSLRVL